MTYRALGLALLLIVFAPLAARSADSSQERAFKNLPWRGGVQHLSASNSTVTLPSGLVMVEGADARQASQILNGAPDDNGLEGIAIVRSTGDTVYYHYNDSGYVSSDDWKNVNAGELLDNIKKNTDEGNAERKKAGVAPLEVVGWAQKPAWDQKTATVRWAIRGRDSSGDLINAVALHLGRHGYETITWVPSGEEYASSGSFLDKMVADQQFDKGSRYADFVNGDKIAAYGLAALVGTAAGATLVKTGAFVAILLALKKLWFVIIAAIYGAFRWAVAQFRGRPRPTIEAAMSEPPTPPAPGT
jgi:uncharacterized membrane-anchored protein